jgi:E3 ubiquitin-protein ligase HECTD2
LLLGDFAENGSWWTGNQEDRLPTRPVQHKAENGPSLVSQRSPHVDWQSLDDWYTAVINCGQSWFGIFEDMAKHDPALAATDAILHDMESQILNAQEYVHTTLLKATEAILKRPSRPLNRPSDLRFLLILLANPLLQASYKAFSGQRPQPLSLPSPSKGRPRGPRGSGPASGQHSGIIKRILGLLSNVSNECHGHLVSWFARYPKLRFVRNKDLVAGFLAYRLLRQSEKKQEVKVDVIEGLIPDMAAGSSPASLHAALGHGPSIGKKQDKDKAKKMLYRDDWQIKSASKMMALIFAANNYSSHRRGITSASSSHADSRVHTKGQILSTSDFYVTLLDESDLVADFEAWEHKRGKFSFCQYPFLLSIWAKIQILEYDARRQMQSKARDAFFDSIITRKAIEQYLVLNVRRDCLVEDSLKAVSEVIGSGSEDIKKGLRIVFKGEEGVDAGGLRKEWFLLLVREVFNPDHGMSTGLLSLPYQFC